MITYAPNISWIFPELPFGLRPRAVAEAGFDALEFGFYGQADLPAVEAAVRDFAMQVVLFNMDVPDWGEANRGYLADPGLREEFRSRLDAALEVADRLQALKLMLPVGLVRADLARGAQSECIVDNLRYAAPLAAEAGVMLTIETLNPWDAPGYFLDSSGEAFEVLRQVDHPSVKYQFDTYHLQRLEGNLTETLENNIAYVGHLQFGDVPGRSEPGTGKLNFADLVTAAERAGYDDYVGLEYIPKSTGAETLAWVPPDRRSRRP